MISSRSASDLLPVAIPDPTAATNIVKLLIAGSETNRGHDRQPIKLLEPTLGVRMLVTRDSLYYIDLHVYS